MNPAIQQLLTTLGITLLLVLPSVWALFRWLGTKWLETKFGERLEAFKHKQNEEIERLRLTINTMFDKTVKLHQHEFEVLPVIWERLSMTLSMCGAFISPYQEFPDLSRMSVGKLQDLLEKRDFEPLDVEDILNCEFRERNTKYQEHSFWKSYGDVLESYRQFHVYFLAKGIFVQPELKAKISHLSGMIYAAIDEQKVEKHLDQPRKDRFEKSTKLRKEGGGLLDEIETEVQNRLWDTKALT